MAITLPTTMQAVCVDAPGRDSQLRWQNCALPKLKPGEVLLKVAAFGINRADLMQRQGLYPPPPGDSAILGLEASGIVVAVADDSLSPLLGQAVFGLVNGGGYAEYVAIPAAQAMAVPKGWSLQQAAATAETFLTAYQLLFLLGAATEGQRVLIHAGASGVGTSAIQLAKARQLQIAVTVGSADKAEFCQQLGADIAINYREQDFSEILAAAWPEGIALVLDPVAGSYLNSEASLLAMDGKIIIYAMMGGRKIPELDLSLLFKKRGQLLCSTLRNRDAAYKAELTRRFHADFAADLATKAIEPVIAAVFSREQVEQAHQLLASNQTIGKLLVTLE
ncbi:MAG: NAD(P)H-quinone oxidoreductase [Alishewanella agri]|nr:NAD(P)H-quinone oxidoreductase [Alishewanella agri]